MKDRFTKSEKNPGFSLKKIKWLAEYEIFEPNIVNLMNKIRTKLKERFGEDDLSEQWQNIKFKEYINLYLKQGKTWEEMQKYASCCMLYGGTANYYLNTAGLDPEGELSVMKFLQDKLDELEELEELEKKKK